MTKLIMAIISGLVVSITGCSPNISGGEISRAQSLCADKGGIEHLFAPTLFGVVDAKVLFGVKCNNNDKFNINTFEVIK